MNVPTMDNKPASNALGGLAGSRRTLLAAGGRDMT